MARIYLIRHAQASFDGDDYDQLSEKGLSQSALLGQHLAKKMVKPDAVYAGTMRRHLQTAETSLSMFPNPVRPVINCSAIWNEFDHHQLLGAYRPELATPEGVRSYLAEQTEQKSALRDLFKNAIRRWMVGKHDDDYTEPWPAFYRRVNEGLQRLVDDVSQAEGSGIDDVLVFTSGGPITAVLLSQMGIPQDRFLQMNWTLVNAGVTKLVTGTRGPFVASVNEHVMFEHAQHRQMISYK